MEQFIKKSDQLNPDSIKKLAGQKALRQTLKTNDSFIVPTPESKEIESLLKGENVGYKTAPHPTYNLTIFTVLN